MKTNSIVDVKGIKVGQAENYEAMTGCTVILCEKGATAGISQRGGAPGTRETDLLRPMHMIQKIHAIVLAGGSAFGLDAAGGAMQFLEENKIGFQSGPAIVPIVPSAILFDLGIGNQQIRPDKKMGYLAAKEATIQAPEQGNHGAGTGSTVGKILGNAQAMKSGIGTASMEIANGIEIGAIVAVNAFGDVIEDGEIIAGTRTLKKGPIKIGADDQFADTRKVMESFAGRQILSFASKQNTVIGVIATNVSLTKEESNHLADVASNGIALAIRPAFTMFDGDSVFALSTGFVKADINLVCAYAPDVFAQAIINGVKAAEPFEDMPAYRSFL